MTRMTAYPKGMEVETEMLLDLLDAATGLKCSLAQGGASARSWTKGELEG